MAWPGPAWKRDARNGRSDRAAKAILAETDPWPGDPDYVEPAYESIKPIRSGRFERALARNTLQRKFLTAYVSCGSINKASQLVGIHQPTHYKWMKVDESYRIAFQEATEAVADLLEGEAIRRAVEGVEKQVFYQGEVCGFITEYSDSLLKFLLRGLKPGRYLERVDLTSHGNSLNIIIGGTAEALDSNGHNLLEGPKGEDYEDGEYVEDEQVFPGGDVDDAPPWPPGGVNFKVVKDYERAHADD